MREQVKECEADRTLASTHEFLYVIKNEAPKWDPEHNVMVGYDWDERDGTLCVLPDVALPLPAYAQLRRWKNGFVIDDADHTRELYVYEIDRRNGSLEKVRTIDRKAVTGLIEWISPDLRFFYTSETESLDGDAWNEYTVTYELTGAGFIEKQRLLSGGYSYPVGSGVSVAGASPDGRQMLLGGGSTYPHGGSYWFELRPLDAETGLLGPPQQFAQYVDGYERELSDRYRFSADSRYLIAMDTALCCMLESGWNQLRIFSVAGGEAKEIKASPYVTSLPSPSGAVFRLLPHSIFVTDGVKMAEYAVTPDEEVELLGMSDFPNDPSGSGGQVDFAGSGNAGFFAYLRNVDDTNDFHLATFVRRGPADLEKKHDYAMPPFAPFLHMPAEE